MAGVVLFHFPHGEPGASAFYRGISEFCGNMPTEGNCIQHPGHWLGTHCVPSPALQAPNHAYQTPRITQGWGRRPLAGWWRDGEKPVDTLLSEARQLT